MSVAALPPPSLQPRMSNIQQRPAGRPLMQPRPSTFTPTIASRPPSAPPQQQGPKAKPAAPAPPSVARRPSAASTPALPTPAVDGSKDTSSSSGKVFAKPSKEWVLPERAKPGRKVSIDEPDNKRQSQNRLSQRAHRARRTDYIQTLEERLRQYEADEIHSNVRLQEVARALKADNERLKKEVVTLRMDINDMATQRDAWEAERSSYEALIGRLSSELNASRGGEDIQTHFVSHTAAATITRTPPHMPTLVPNEQRRPTTDCPICPDPDPDCPCQQTNHDEPHPPPLARRTTATLAALHLAVKAMAEQDPTPTPTPGGNSCGLCQSNDECLCRVVDIEEEEDVKPTIFPTPSPDFDIGGSVSDGCGLCTSATFCACKASAGSASSESPGPSMGVASISATTTSNTNGYPTTSSTSAVPLRLRRARPATNDRKAPIWSLDSAESSSSTSSALHPSKKKDDASCSGDPNNCEACRDDKFGKEFCENLFEKTETPTVKAGFQPCADCPGNCMSIKNLLSPTSPEVSNHEHAHEHAHAHENGHAHADDIEDIPPNSSRAPQSSHSHQSQAHSQIDTMTCDQAWKALKAHPNSRFASLSLLADVVAGRTVCTGPQDVGGLGSAPASGPSSPAVICAAQSPAPTGASSPVVPASAVPVSSSASRKRNMAVETSAVRDALRLLDKTTASPSPALNPTRPRDSVDSAVELRGVKRRKVEPVA